MENLLSAWKVTVACELDLTVLAKYPAFLAASHISMKITDQLWYQYQHNYNYKRFIDKINHAEIIRENETTFE